jgi:hypothetical protein
MLTISLLHFLIFKTICGGRHCLDLFNALQIMFHYKQKEIKFDDVTNIKRMIDFDYSQFCIVPRIV